MSTLLLHYYSTAVRTSGGVEEGDLVAHIDVARSSDEQLRHIQVDERIAAVVHEHLRGGRSVSTCQRVNQA